MPTGIPWEGPLSASTPVGAGGVHEVLRSQAEQQQQQQPPPMLASRRRRRIGTQHNRRRLSLTCPGAASHRASFGQTGSLAMSGQRRWRLHPVGEHLQTAEQVCSSVGSWALCGAPPSTTVHSPWGRWLLKCSNARLRVGPICSSWRLVSSRATCRGRSPPQWCWSSSRT